MPSRKAAFNFVFCFACVFAGLSLPLPGLSSGARKSATWLGNSVVHECNFRSGARLHFSEGDAPEASAPEPSTATAKEEWTTTLWVSASDGRAIQVPIDLRLLGYLPLAAFVALALSTPAAWRQKFETLALGLVILGPLIMLLIAAPLLTFLGGTGPIRVFELGRASHAFLNVVYRALVAPPGMAYALPLLVWWLLLRRTVSVRPAQPAA